MTKAEQIKWGKKLHDIATKLAPIVNTKPLTDWSDVPPEIKELYQLSVRDLLAAYEKSKKKPTRI